MVFSNQSRFDRKPPARSRFRKNFHNFSYSQRSRNKKYGLDRVLEVKFGCEQFLTRNSKNMSVFSLVFRQRFKIHRTREARIIQDTEKRCVYRYFSSNTCIKISYTNGIAAHSYKICTGIETTNRNAHLFIFLLSRFKYRYENVFFQYRHSCKFIPIETPMEICFFKCHFSKNRPTSSYYLLL